MAKVILVDKWGDLRLVKKPSYMVHRFVMERKTTDSLGKEKWDKCEEVTLNMQKLLDEIFPD